MNSFTWANVFNWTIYLIRLALFLVLAVLFRIYLVGIFLTRAGAPIMAAGCFAAAAYFGRIYLEPHVLDMLAVWEQRPGPSDLLKGFVGFVEPQPYVAVAVAAGVALLVTLYWLRPLLRAVLLAFPMARRPLPPQRRWTPPKHIIRAARTTHETPELPVRYFDGRVETLAVRLKPELQELMQGEHTPSQKVPRPQQRDPEAPVSQKPLRTPSRTEERPRAPQEGRGRPSAPKVPPRRPAGYAAE